MENSVADAIFVDAPPERVFAVLLDPEEVRVWMDTEEAAPPPEAPFTEPGFDSLMHMELRNRVNSDLAVEGLEVITL